MERRSKGVVRDLWDDLQIVDDKADLAFIGKKPKVAEALASFQADEVLEAINTMKRGEAGERPVKQVELEALLRAPEGFGDDVPIDPDFHARRLPDAAWRRSTLSAGIASVVQLHRLREVLALIGFTRLEAAMPDIHGEYETDVERADIALEPQWFPAVENRGEGVFIHVAKDAIVEWEQRPAVQQRLEDLRQGQMAWTEDRNIARPFPGGPYVLLHTLSHLLIRSLAMRCGYPASSIRERIYVEDGAEGLRYGILVYTGTPDAEGTLGGLVQQAPIHRRPSRGCIANGFALLQRPDLCAARARHQHGRALAPWVRLSRLRAHSRNLVRDAKRLPRSCFGRAGAWARRRRLLPGTFMTDALVSLPSHLRRRLEGALDTGLITTSSSTATVCSVLGLRDGSEELLEDLNALEQVGVSGRAAAAWLRAVEHARNRSPAPDLVWSGPEVPGVHARDTRRVYEELLGAAERSVWASTYVYFDGPRAFADLAVRMDAIPELQVTLLLNIQRRSGDTTAPDQLVRRFANRFWTKDWPGEARPSVYYDPRSLNLDGPAGVLHAKAVVTDGVAVFMTSANLTDAAFDRNIELGVLIRDRALAASVTSHFRGLIDTEALSPLPTQ